jgi:phosphatidylserine/phosphatidylglycerophosphate/cardiolipin synthase-like enzyme
VAKFLTTNAISAELESIIIGATAKLVLISPYWKISNLFAERLENASKKGVKITILFGKSDLKEDQAEILGKLGNLEIYFVENLHAKCYFNESKMIITSMNLHSFSERNNREMGVLIDKTTDFELFESAREEAQSILQIGDKGFIEKADYPRQIPRHNHGQRAVSNLGCCLRCGVDIKYNLSKPLCHECYDEWAEWGNEEHREQFCHSCGSPADTSLASPQCYQCYRDSKKKRG